MLQAASAGVGVELKTLRQQRDGLEDQIQRLEATIARAKGKPLPQRSCNVSAATVGIFRCHTLLMRVNAGMHG